MSENRGLSVWYIDQHLRDDLEAPAELKVHELKPKILDIGRDVICPRDGGRGVAYIDVPQTQRKDRFGSDSTHMLSYSWSYPIGTVVSALTSYCRRHNLRHDEMIAWICCFCINQHRVEQALKVDLNTFRETFENRVAQIGKVLSLLWPWNGPLNLRRLWCVFEIHTAINTDNCELEFILPDGELEGMRTCLCGNEGEQKVGSISGIAAINDALGRIRMEEAQTKYAEDRLRIFKFMMGDIDVENRLLLSEAIAKHNGVVSRQLQTWFIGEVQKFRHVLSVSDQLPIGWMLVTECKFEEATALYNDVQELVDPESREDGKLAFERGQCYRRQRQYKQAMKSYVYAMRVYESIGAEKSVDAACNFMGLGITLDKMRKHDEALNIYRHMLEAFEAADSKCADYANGLKHMGNCYYAQGLLADAVECFIRAYECFQSLDLTNNVWCLDAVTGIGKAYIDLGDLDVAREWFTEAECKFVALGCNTESEQYKTLVEARERLEFEREYARLCNQGEPLHRPSCEDMSKPVKTKSKFIQRPTCPINLATFCQSAFRKTWSSRRSPASKIDEKFAPPMLDLGRQLSDSLPRIKEFGVFPPSPLVRAISTSPLNLRGFSFSTSGPLPSSASSQAQPQSVIRDTEADKRLLKVSLGKSGSYGHRNFERVLAEIFSGTSVQVDALLEQAPKKLDGSFDIDEFVDWLFVDSK